MVMLSPPTAAAIDDHAPALSMSRSHVRRMTVLRCLRVIGVWIQRSRQRHDLAELDDRLLDDVGISRTAAAHEIAKPFWRLV